MKKILVIEDEPQMRKNVITILVMEGFEALAAENGKIGLERARAAKPDLILCDVMMPELDGHGVLEALRTEKETQAIPFLFLTAKGDRDMASEVDYAIEEQVRALLAELTPDIGFLGEENGTSGATDGLMWALDPVDGTVNFVHGSPLYGESIGVSRTVQVGDAVVALGDHVAQRLQDPHGLAEPLRTTDEDELAAAHAAAQVGVERVEAGGPRPPRRAVRR